MRISLVCIKTENVVSTEASACIKTQACNFIKKETLAQVLSCEFCEISKNTFFTEHLRTTVSVSGNLTIYITLILMF